MLSLPPHAIWHDYILSFPTTSSFRSPLNWLYSLAYYCTLCRPMHVLCSCSVPWNLPETKHSAHSSEFSLSHESWAMRWAQAAADRKLLWVIIHSPAWAYSVWFKQHLNCVIWPPVIILIPPCLQNCHKGRQIQHTDTLYLLTNERRLSDMAWPITSLLLCICLVSEETWQRRGNLTTSQRFR